MSALRLPFFLFSVAMIWLVVAVEIGANWVLAAGVEDPPGWGIATLAFVDGILAYRITLMLLSILTPATVGYVQGIATLILSFFAAIAAFVTIFIILTELMIMVSLFLGAIFGTIAYLAIWGDFARGEAATLLGLLLMLKIAFAVGLVLAHQRFLQVKALVVHILVAIGLNLLVAFLHALPPGILASIFDRIAGIIVTIVGLIYLILSLIGSIPAVLKALRIDKAFKRLPEATPWSLAGWDEAPSGRAG